MPRYSYTCEAGHSFDVRFSSFTTATPYVDSIQCQEGTCEHFAKRVLEAPALHFLGSGWTAPVPSGRTQTKGADATKVAAETIQEFGAKNWVQSVKESK